MPQWSQGLLLEQNFTLWVSQTTAKRCGQGQGGRKVEQVKMEPELKKDPVRGSSVCRGESLWSPGIFYSLIRSCSHFAIHQDAVTSCPLSSQMLVPPWKGKKHEINLEKELEVVQEELGKLTRKINVLEYQSNQLKAQETELFWMVRK